MSRPIIFIIMLVAFGLAMISTAFAHDPDNPQIDKWYESLKMPDQPAMSCCGESDAYWCDGIHVRQGRTYCVVTDDRPDEPLHRTHLELGTEILIPDHKLTWKDGNPTGHAILFISPGVIGSERVVYCFVQNGGS